jgi:phosphodiesterase/alkaline phosphatase D-like protein
MVESRHEPTPRSSVHLGDTMYSDSEIPGRLRPIALTVPAKWSKYTTNLGNARSEGCEAPPPPTRAGTTTSSGNDFSPAEDVFSSLGVETRISGRLLYRRGTRAFRDYAPVTYSCRNGIYRTVRWGRNLELFLLDQRSFRSAKADERGRV